MTTLRDSHLVKHLGIEVSKQVIRAAEASRIREALARRPTGYSGHYDFSSDGRNPLPVFMLPNSAGLCLVPNLSYSSPSRSTLVVLIANRVLIPAWKAQDFLEIVKRCGYRDPLQVGIFGEFARQSYGFNVQGSLPLHLKTRNDFEQAGISVSEEFVLQRRNIIPRKPIPLGTYMEPPSSLWWNEYGGELFAISLAPSDQSIWNTIDVGQGKAKGLPESWIR